MVCMLESGRLRASLPSRRCGGCLRYMADTAGDFYEMFEINNSFRLAAKGGLLVEFSLNDGKIEKLDVYGNEFCKAERVTVHLPEALGGDFEVNVKK